MDNLRIGAADDIGALTAATVDRMWAGLMVQHQRQYQRKDLIDYCLPFARDAIAKSFDPSRSSLSTFVTTVVKRRVLDLHRRLDRERRRETEVATMRAYNTSGVAFEDVDESLPVSEMAVQVYRQAVHTVGRQPRGRGRRCYEPAQEAALLAIKKGLRLSDRGVISYLTDNPSVVRSCGFKRLPSRRKIQRLWRIYSRTSANNRAAGRIRMTRLASDYITEKQAAVLVGLSWTTLRRWREMGNTKFPYYKPGGRIRYKRTEVEAYMEAQAVRPQAKAG